jgi:glycosyltransferase involved in cell wall biosynthesis
VKVLLSAFACQPHCGSEMEVGWKWAVHLAKLGQEVWVLTRSESRPAIELELVRLCEKRLHFRYYDLPEPICRWFSSGRKLSLQIYYALWQWRAVRVAHDLHAHQAFDCVHHVTFAGLRAPSFMGTLGIPFIFGPVAGGERAPWKLRFGYGLKGWLLDALRDLANATVRFNPFMLRTFASATTIYVTSRDTLALLPPAQRKKAVIELAIGSEDDDGDSKVDLAETRRSDAMFRVLYVGNFQYLKGMHLGIPAFARLLKARPGARLTMIGHGSAKARWQKLAERLGIAANIDWEPWLPRAELTTFYVSHQLMLFPSLHDSGGTVVLESLAHGLPVVCLNIGGPGNIVINSCGRLIDVAGQSSTEVIVRLSQALFDLTNEETRLQLAQGARKRSRDFTWRKKVARIYGEAMRCP